MAIPSSEAQEERGNELRFHFYSLQFTPYKAVESTHSSVKITRDVLTFLSQELLSHKGYLVDRHEKRKGGDSRELFLSSAVILPKEQRILCSMALLRTGRTPKLKPADKFLLIPITELGTPAEETHFYIDYSRSHAVLCIEFNHYGPRASDIEFYFRNVAHDKLRLASATQLELYMDAPIAETLENLKHVLNLEVKMKPQSLTQLDKDLIGNYFTGFTTLAQRVKPKFIKLEASFQSQGGGVQSTALNKEGTGMVRVLLERFLKSPYNIDCFDGFTVKYESIEGKEELFNLLKGKKEVVKEIDLKKVKKKREVYDLVKSDFDEFISSL
jgi:hypothetical protein